MAVPHLTPEEGLLLQSGELFVTAAGFEKRVLAFPKILQTASEARNAALVLEYRPRDDKNRLQELRTCLSEKGCQVQTIIYDRHTPDGFDWRFGDVVAQPGVDGLCVDISGMSRLAIMIILEVARGLNLPLRVVYSEALRYAPSEEEFDNAKAAGQQHLPTSFIHTGVYDVLHVPCLSSIRMQNQATLLIAFDSFNESLCQALVNVINPSRFILVNGKPPRKELEWREQATLYVHQRLRKEWAVEDDNDPIKSTSTLYYEETYQLLSNIYWRFSGSHRIILAPTGSKMQTLGSYLLRAVHDDVHVAYPTVEGFFADKYSEGVREKWALTFGPMGDFVARLRQEEIAENLGLPVTIVDTDVE